MYDGGMADRGAGASAYVYGVGISDIDRSKAQDFVNGTPVCHTPCMARTDVIIGVGGYSVDDKLLRMEDYHLWFKVFAAGHKLYMMDEPLYKKRDDRNAVARRNWLTRRNEAYVKHVGYKMIGLPWWTQIYAIVPILKYMMPDLFIITLIEGDKYGSFNGS